jgi:hypothetical protein
MMVEVKIMKLKIILLIALITAFGSIGFAQTKKTKTITPKFSGSVQTRKKEFKAFIIKNVGRRISLNLTFDGDIEPYGYRSEFADPLFEVDNYRYFLICKDRQTLNVPWTDRCKKINWNAENKIISGFFKITEPDPKMMRTNRTFNLTPTR